MTESLEIYEEAASTRSVVPDLQVAAFKAIFHGWNEELFAETAAMLFQQTRDGLIQSLKEEE
jgi:hypothetical protein